MPAPLVSVILCCRNPGRRLLGAVESVLGQRGADLECILIDAVSDDGSLAALPEALRSRCRIVSEPDHGVFEAMNKGVRLAVGEWVYFLGADDRLAGESVLAELGVLLRGTEAAVVSGRSLYADGRVYGPELGRVASRNFLHHQATFYRRELFDRQGGYDEGLRIQGDYEFNLRLILAGERIECCDRLVARCGCGGLSDGGRWANYREEIAARHRHLPSWRCWLWDVGSVLRYCRKSLLMRLRKRPE